VTTQCNESLLHFATRPRPTSSTFFPYTTLFRSFGLGQQHVHVPGHAAGHRMDGVFHGHALGRQLRGQFLERMLGAGHGQAVARRSEEHTSELQSRENLVCRLLLEKKKRSTSNTA